MHKSPPRTYDAKKVQKSYARVAWYYNLWSRLTESRAARKALELAEIKNGESILEIAAGTGIVFAELVNRNKEGLTIGIDLSPKMLSRALNRAKKGQSNCHLFCGSALQLPFPKNRFDFILNNYMFDLLPENKFVPILLEFKRVLKNPGRLVIITMAPGEKWFNQFWGWLATRFPQLLTGCRPVAMHPYLTEAGFSNIEAINVSQNTFPSQVLKAEIINDGIVLKIRLTLPIKTLHCDCKKVNFKGKFSNAFS